MALQEGHRRMQVARRVVVRATNRQALPDDLLARQVHAARRMHHPRPRIVAARPQHSDALPNHRGNARRLHHDVGQTGRQIIGFGGRHGRAAATPGEVMPTRQGFNDRDAFPSSLSQQGDHEASHQPATLHHCVAALPREPFLHRDRRGQGAVGGRGHGIGHVGWNLAQRGASPQHDVGAVAAREGTRAFHRGMPILEQALALLGQVPFRAGTACPARVRQGPRHPLAQPSGVAPRAHGLHVAHRLVPENAWARRLATALHRVQVGAANGGEANADEDLAACGRRDLGVTQPERATGTVENGVGDVAHVVQNLRAPPMLGRGEPGRATLWRAPRRVEIRPQGPAIDGRSNL